MFLCAWIHRLFCKHEFRYNVGEEDVGVCHKCGAEREWTPDDD